LKFDLDLYLDLQSQESYEHDPFTCKRSRSKVIIRFKVSVETDGQTEAIALYLCGIWPFTRTRRRRRCEITRYGAYTGEVVCEPPNNNLSKFEGALTWKDETYSLDNEKILLRGCVLRNTAWCYGLVLFAGRDTKLMMNSGRTKFKRTHIDRLMNRIIIGVSRPRRGQLRGRRIPRDRFPPPT